MYYFEHIAEDKGDKERREKIDRTIKKLQTILDSLKLEVAGQLAHSQFATATYIIIDIDRRVTELQHRIDSVFEKPELQRHPVSKFCSIWSCCLVVNSTTFALFLRTVGFLDARIFTRTSKTDKANGGRQWALR
jgi:hypothetical protein